MPLMTLTEYAKTLPETSIQRPIIEMFARSSDVFSALPFEDLGGKPVYEGFRTSQLPAVGFRAINEGSTSGIGRMDPFQEATYILDHDLDVDAAIVRRAGENRRAQEEAMAVASMGKIWIDTFLKGDNATDLRSFDGLQKRADKFSRKIDNSVAAGGGPLSLLKLDQAINQVNGATHIIAPYTSQPLWIGAARNTTLSGFVIQSWDEVGKPKMSYAGLPILWGYPKDDHGDVLPFTEVGVGGGAAATTSFYVVAFGEGKLRGLQIKPLDVNDIGLLQDGITFRTHVSWDVGLVDEHKYCLARLTSITNAAFAA
jgi:hypothetical protein